VIVWRIAVEAQAYSADDLSGEGARQTGGRWNQKGLAMVYCSRSIALAVLETVVHLEQMDLPLNRFLVKIVIPDSVWGARRTLDQNSAPGGWNALPVGMASIVYRSNWLQSGASAVLEVPSVIVPEESNVLLNPNHPDAAAIKAHTVRRWEYDRRI